MADKKISALTASTVPLAGTEVLPVVQGGVTKKVSVADLTAGRSFTSTGYESKGDISVKNGTGFTSSNSVIQKWSAYAGAANQFEIAAIEFVTSDFVDGGGIVFKSTTSATPTEGFRLTPSGNIAFPLGKGIDFSADGQAAGMTSELLDDYEEGTFTPTIVGTSSAGTATYANQLGKYTKTGRLVTVEIYLNWSSGTGTGSLVIGGLPFNIGSNAYGSASAWAEISLASLNYLSSRMLSGGSTIDLFNAPVGGGVTSPVAYTSTGSIMITATYSV